jgi:hypothetical protein
VRGSENHSALAQYLMTNAAVVEIRNWESQEEAWRRYLADNPQSIRAHVKIFHYPTRNSGRGKSSTKTARAGEMA